MVTGRGSVTYTDGVVVEVSTTPLDFMRWDRWRAKRKESPNPIDAPFTFEMFLVYTALIRAHELDGATAFDVWAETVSALELDLSTPDPTPTETSDA